MNKTAEEIKKEIIENILSRECASWESLTNDAYDEGFKQGLAAAPPPASEGDITDYWRKRCIAAEKVIDSTPYNPFISQKELKLYSAWRKLNSTPVPLATLPTREPEERKFSQSEIEALQSSIYEMTGAGEVMGLFNKMLGVNAG